MPGPSPVVRRCADVNPVPCPCGSATRIITGADNDLVSVHRTRIEGEAKRHYHREHQECYVVLEGEGVIELDEATHAVGPGDTILIPAGTEHALRGQFEIINIVTPPFDAEDEFIVE